MSAHLTDRSILLGHRTALLLGLSIWLAGVAGADTGTWQTDAAVGPSEVSYTLTFTCTGAAVVCDPLNAYSDTQISALTGAATLDIDTALETIQFDQDSLQDVGAGPAPAFVTLDGSDLTFAGLALFGIPEVQAPVVFSTDNPPIAVTGLDLLAPGSYPISTTLTWGGLGDVVGDLALTIPEIQVTPAPTSVTGTLVVLGDVDMDGLSEYEIHDLTATTTSVDQYVEGTLVVDVHVTAVLSANLSGEMQGTVAPPVPLAGLPGVGLLACLLASSGVLWMRRLSTAD